MKRFCCILVMAILIFAVCLIGCSPKDIPSSTSSDSVSSGTQSSSSSVSSEKVSSNEVLSSDKEEPSSATVISSEVTKSTKKGVIYDNSGVFIEQFDWNNPEHLVGRSIKEGEQTVAITLKIVDKNDKPVALLNCNYLDRKVTDKNGEVTFDAFFDNPTALSFINAKPNRAIAGDTNYWVEYRMNIAKGTKPQTIKLVWNGITPEQTIASSTDKIVVTVKDNKGNLMKNADVYLERKLAQGEVPSTQIASQYSTDENGVFVLCNPPKQEYTLECFSGDIRNKVDFTYNGGIVEKEVILSTN